MTLTYLHLVLEKSELFCLFDHMAKVTITIEDTDESMDLKFQFDPPYDNHDRDKNTASQEMGFRIAEILSNEAGAEVAVVRGS